MSLMVQPTETAGQQFVGMAVFGIFFVGLLRMFFGIIFSSPHGQNEHCLVTAVSFVYFFANAIFLVHVIMALMDPYAITAKQAMKAVTFLYTDVLFGDQLILADPTPRSCSGEEPMLILQSLRSLARMLQFTSKTVLKTSCAGVKAALHWAENVNHSEVLMFVAKVSPLVLALQALVTVLKSNGYNFTSGLVVLLQVLFVLDKGICAVMQSASRSEKYVCQAHPCSYEEAKCCLRDEDCPICFAPFEPADELFVLRPEARGSQAEEEAPTASVCNHVFHQKCLTQCSKVRQRLLCPVCRSEYRLPHSTLRTLRETFFR